MEFETWDQLADAFLGRYGEQEQREAIDNLNHGLAGADGDVDRQVAYEEFLADLEAGEYDDAEGELDPAEVAAAEERVVNAEAESVLHDKIDRLEEKIGRPLTDKEEEEIIDRGLSEKALDDPAGIDLVREHADQLKSKIGTEAGREEVMLAAAHRSAEGREEPFDPAERAVSEVEKASDDPEKLREMRMVGAFELAKMGTSYAEIDAAIEDEGDGDGDGEE